MESLEEFQVESLEEFQVESLEEFQVESLESLPYPQHSAASHNAYCNRPSLQPSSRSHRYTEA